MSTLPEQGDNLRPRISTVDRAVSDLVAWGLRPSGPTALASFDVTAGSLGPMMVSWPASERDLTRFAISLEPGRTLPVKPSNVIASGSDA
jgi:hypothetical protein